MEKTEKQLTTVEFGERLTLAVEGHPQAPASLFGRQSWLLDKLKKETGTEVSPNTMSKWFNGNARPRTDKIRDLARVLKVDEIWLSLGRTPAQVTKVGGVDHWTAPAGHGASLLLAGLIECEGGRVSFASPDKKPVDLHVDINGKQFDAIVVQPTKADGKCSCMVVEPVGDARIFAVQIEEKCTTSACVSVIEITHIKRQNFGGFSVVQMSEAAKGGYEGLDMNDETVTVKAMKKVSESV